MRDGQVLAHGSAWVSRWSCLFVKRFPSISNVMTATHVLIAHADFASSP
ncbi:hypothetical protein BN940_05581 [Castellaniella defragrans 65Phen]|uniref:Uncharacterized protein n=1 Tax=Castellaniella defragrans (strain DSM 12143 / CCUG 39792 / 65Phen) TaxID=1437824 RepID=W8X8S5_CASD6|nr:hypothetical protein BN940_05581 [Castellaniella defragrans 65Phen]